MTPFSAAEVKLLQEPVTAIVSASENPHLTWVEYAATLWRAKLYNFACSTIPLCPGQLVTVVGIQGTTLLLTVESTGEG